MDVHSIYPALSEMQPNQMLVCYSYIQDRQTFSISLHNCDEGGDGLLSINTGHSSRIGADDRFGPTADNQKAGTNRTGYQPFGRIRVDTPTDVEIHPTTVLFPCPPRKEAG